MYAKCEYLLDACMVFDKLRLSNVVLWTSLIRGYVENGQDKEALRYVQLMQDQAYVEIGFCEDMLVGAKHTFSRDNIYMQRPSKLGLMEMCLWETL